MWHIGQALAALRFLVRRYGPGPVWQAPAAGARRARHATEEQECAMGAAAGRNLRFEAGRSPQIPCRGALNEGLDLDELVPV